MIASAGIIPAQCKCGAVEHKTIRRSKVIMTVDHKRSCICYQGFIRKFFSTIYTMDFT